MCHESKQTQTATQSYLSGFFGLFNSRDITNGYRTSAPALFLAVATCFITPLTSNSQLVGFTAAHWNNTAELGRSIAPFTWTENNFNAVTATISFGVAPASPSSPINSATIFNDAVVSVFDTRVPDFINIKNPDFEQSATIVDSSGNPVTFLSADAGGNIYPNLTLQGTSPLQDNQANNTGIFQINFLFSQATIDSFNQTAIDNGGSFSAYISLGVNSFDSSGLLYLGAEINSPYPNSETAFRTHNGITLSASTYADGVGPAIRFVTIGASGLVMRATSTGEVAHLTGVSKNTRPLVFQHSTDLIPPSWTSFHTGTPQVVSYTTYTYEAETIFTNLPCTIFFRAYQVP